MRHRQPGGDLDTATRHRSNCLRRRESGTHRMRFGHDARRDHLG
ncbi:hypothetical protein HMPREF0591_0584 [Mycobacterium parascrofulaceum ATCC BAA-614]|uniref:Uncharacterized protein n=1 Tax=Mycobacterium parascrofulaceum ATCC BAA-614 TaxID=525368 RepID=D5P340_9MYCO|nr:hypothetical protein HMPREF0591_0584 [Mycobacterium parascrofulaceum ATCC BAA-614]